MNNVKPPKMGAISKVFAGMEVLDGVKKTRDEFKNTNNIYDDKLGVSMKGHKAFKTASDELDDLLKVAGVGNWTGRAAREAIKRGAKDLVTEFDTATAKNVKNAISAAKNKQIGQAVKSGAKALPGVALNAGTAIGAGIGVTKGLDALDKKKSDENKAAHKIIGATIGAGLAATALGGGGMYQGSKIIADTAKKSLLKHIPDQYANTNAAFKTVKKTLKDTSKDSAVSNAIKKAKKVQSQISKSQLDAAKNNAKYNANIENSASRIINKINGNLHNENPKFKKDIVGTLRDLASQEQSNFVNKFMMKNKGATIEDAVKAWKVSADKANFDKASRLAVPTAKRINKMASEELDTLIKIAGIDMGELKSAIKPVVKGAGKAGAYIGDKVITPALTAMSTTAAPIIATTLLSQKMLNQAKADSKNDQKSAQGAPAPQTLVIKLDNGTAHQEEKVASVDDQTHDIGNVLTDVLSGLNEIKGAEKLRTEKVHIGNGKKKTFRMQDQHGMDMMQP